MKRFSPVRDTQRGSQSYMKERRGRRGDREEQEEKKGDSRGERSTQLSVPECSPQPRHPQRFTELDWEEKGKGGNRGVLR